jgi:hypothetical protein
MMSLLTPILLVALFGATPFLDLSRDRLTVHVNAAESQIRPHAPGQRSPYGESVSFPVRAEFYCHGDGVAESVVISVADTHLRHVPAPGEKFIATKLTVPGEQLAPAETGDFCASDAGNSDRILMIPAVATAQVSLRCRNDAAAAISFSSAALPLRLVCHRDAAGHDASDSPASFPM